MKIFIPLLLVLALLNCNFLSAQKVDSVMNLYADSFPQEKVHFHFDKSLYRKGETIWYKVYLLSNLLPSNVSKNFYADWYDNNGKLLLHTVNPIYLASTRGQFEIPANYQGNSIHVRAYTQWMLNFDSSFLYEKDILVDQSSVTKKSKVQDKQISTIHFFPEGGDWIAGIETRIAFSVNDQTGKPVSAIGAIVNQKGDFIDSFSTTHDGMGFVTLNCKPNNQLSAIWLDAYGNKYNNPLPLTKPSGIAIQVQPTNNKAVFVVQSVADSTHSGTIAHVIAHINQQVVYMSKVNLKNKYAVGEIPTTDLPSGVMQVSVFNDKWLPVAERVVFINNGIPSFTPNISVITRGANKREKNEFEIGVDDSIRANMSIAITDADWYNDSTSNIVSQFLLSSDIKGYINKPAYYFSSDADSVKQHLDLVMLTHGWRRFKWDAITKGILPKINYSRDSDYLEIKGKVFGHSFVRRGAQSLNLILLSKDSSKQLISLPLDKNGNFLQKGILFFDTVKAYYQFNGDAKLTDMATVKITNGLLDNYPKKLKPEYDYPIILPNYMQDSANLLGTKNLLAAIDRADKRARAHELAEVTVHSKTKRAVDVLDDKYATGVFSGGDSYQFDLVNDKYANSYPNIFFYLQGRVAGLQVNENDNNGMPSLRWRGGTPELFLDELRIRSDELQSISIADIAYIKVFRPPFFGSGGGGEGGAIAIYTRKAEDVQYVPGKGMGYAVIAGYTKYKEFYSPDYSYNNPIETDTRTTLYWNPYILTNKHSKSVRISFYNNDISKKLRVIIEGVNALGKLTHYEKIIE